MGTYYATLSGDLTGRSELANRQDPELIAAIHSAYIDAGCSCIKTNTFALPVIAMEHTEAEALDLLDRAWAIAREAVAGRDIAIFADFGPPPSGDGAWESIYLALTDRFLEFGATNFLFETFPNAPLLRILTAHIRAREPEAFIICSFAVSSDGFTALGLSGRALAEGLFDAGLADAVGFNCVSGPGHLLSLVEGIDSGHYLLSIMPNAGYPATVSGRTTYSSSAAYFADRLREMAEAGVKFLGGCCGTDPNYIRSAAEALDMDRRAGASSAEQQGRPRSVSPAIASLKPPGRGEHPQSPAVLEAGVNRFRDKLLRGERVIAVELDSPLDSDISKYMAGAAALKTAGADIITVADCPVARSRMDSSIVACKLRRELGIDALPHLTCRDRNLNATRALLLGLSAEGVHNVLIVTGDPIPTAERDLVKSVYNFNSRMLARYIQELNSQVFQTPFFIGGALNVNAVNFEPELRRAREKVEQGIGVLFTQPVMTPRAATNLRRARETLDVKLLGGIMPVVSYRNARFIAEEIQGMEIAPETVERFRDLSKEEAARLGLDLSLEMAAQIARDVDGYYLITPFSRTDMIVEILEKL